MTELGQPFGEGREAADVSGHQRSRREQQTVAVPGAEVILDEPRDVRREHRRRIHRASLARLEARDERQPDNVNLAWPTPITTPALAASKSSVNSPGTGPVKPVVLRL